MPTWPWLTPPGVTPLRRCLLSTPFRASAQLTAPGGRCCICGSGRRWGVGGRWGTALCRSALAPMSLKGLSMHFTLTEHPGVQRAGLWQLVLDQARGAAAEPGCQSVPVQAWEARPLSHVQEECSAATLPTSPLCPPSACAKDKSQLPVQYPLSFTGHFSSPRLGLPLLLKSPKAPHFRRMLVSPSSFAQNRPRHVSCWAELGAASKPLARGGAICGCEDREVTGLDVEEEGLSRRESEGQREP